MTIKLLLIVKTLKIVTITNLLYLFTQNINISFIKIRSQLFGNFASILDIYLNKQI